MSLYYHNHVKGKYIIISNVSPKTLMHMSTTMLTSTSDPSEDICHVSKSFMRHLFPKELQPFCPASLIFLARLAISSENRLRKMSYSKYKLLTEMKAHKWKKFSSPHPLKFWSFITVGQNFYYFFCLKAKKYTLSNYHIHGLLGSKYSYT